MYVGLLILSCAIFVCWGFIGYSVVDQLAPRYPAVRRWLLAPAAGLAVSTILVNVVSRLGFTAKIFGWPLLSVLIAANVLYWLFRHPRVGWFGAARWAAVFVGALVLVGWPLMVAGTDWVSTGNGDMTNYLLGANHFYEHGFYQLPSLGELLAEVDPSWDSSFQYSLGEQRSASQMILAWFMAVSGFAAAQGYMILIVALHLVVLSTSAALICSDRGRQNAALAAVIVIGSSANLTLGTFIQLMPQDLGLAALTACATVLLDYPPAGTALYRQGVLGGLFAAALLVAYPELSPFVALALITYCAVAVIRKQIRLRRWLLFMAVAGVSTVVFANQALPGALHFLLWNLTYSSHVVGSINDLFPYYLTPAGFAQFWGFIAQGSGDLSSLQVQLLVVAGGVLFVVALVLSVEYAWRLEPVAIIGGTMLLLFAPLFAIGNGFGMFKLAMYAQPFVLGALTIAVWDTLWTHRTERSAREPLEPA